MDKTSILNQYRDICSDVLNKLTAKLNKKFQIVPYGDINIYT